MAKAITPIIFVGGSRLTPVESLIAEAHEAIAADLLERLYLFDRCNTRCGSLCGNKIERRLVIVDAPRGVSGRQREGQGSSNSRVADVISHWSISYI